MTQTELCKYGQEPKSCTSNPMDCQCAIDASLAQTQEPVQKPVAVVSSCTGVGDKGVRVKWLGGFPQIGDRLYFHPPQRTWVDLTDEEIDNINYTSAHMLAREVLAKFKEKNT